MKKTKLSKLVALMLVVVLAFTACGSKNNGKKNDTPSTEGTDESTNTNDTTKEDDTSSDDTASDDTATTTKLKIAMVTDVGGINDQSFNQGAWEGLQRAEKDLGVEVNYLESKTEADYAANIETLVDQDNDLIVACGFLMADAIKDAAETYPDQKFAIIDDDSNANYSNVSCLMFKQNEASYLVGVVAAMMSQTGKVGFVLGMSTPVMNQFGYGYVAGVLDTNPDATVEQYNANSFGDAAAGKAATIQMYTNGADVVFQAAGGTGNGVIEAAKEQGKYAIGVDKDQSYLAPENILTSAMKRCDNAIYDLIEKMTKGEEVSGIQTYGMENGGVDIAPTTDLLTDEVLAKVKEVKEKILSGEIVVPNTQEEFEAKYGDVYTLD
jgi:basic membrane protein A and related proteins